MYLTEYVGICSPKLDNMLKSKYPNDTCSYKCCLETERFLANGLDSVYNLEIDTLDANVRRCVEEYPEVKKAHRQNMGISHTDTLGERYCFPLLLPPQHEQF